VWLHSRGGGIPAAAKVDDRKEKKKFQFGFMSGAEKKRQQQQVMQVCVA
jgi:hypothetical protein